MRDNARLASANAVFAVCCAELALCCAASAILRTACISVFSRASSRLIGSNSSFTPALNADTNGGICGKVRPVSLDDIDII